MTTVTQPGYLGLASFGFAILPRRGSHGKRFRLAQRGREIRSKVSA